MCAFIYLWWECAFQHCEWQKRNEFTDVPLKKKAKRIEIGNHIFQNASLGQTTESLCIVFPSEIFLISCCARAQAHTGNTNKRNNTNPLQIHTYTIATFFFLQENGYKRCHTIIRYYPSSVANPFEMYVLIGPILWMSCKWIFFCCLFRFRCIPIYTKERNEDTTQKEKKRINFCIIFQLRPHHQQYVRKEIISWWTF